MILSAQTIAELCNPELKFPMIVPFEGRKTIVDGMSYGLSACGYDIRVKQDLILSPNDFVLASSIERFEIPRTVMGEVKDKSSWARHGLTVQNTVIEPGWGGFLTLELKNIGNETIRIRQGCPIAQVIFKRLDYATMLPYTGKYQNQEDRPVPSRKEPTRG